jgi:hypothetical protein
MVTAVTSYKACCWQFDQAHNVFKPKIRIFGANSRKILRTLQFTAIPAERFTSISMSQVTPAAGLRDFLQYWAMSFADFD